MQLSRPEGIVKHNGGFEEAKIHRIALVVSIMNLAFTSIEDHLVLDA